MPYMPPRRPRRCASTRAVIATTRITPAAMSFFIVTPRLWTLDSRLTLDSGLVNFAFAFRALNLDEMQPGRNLARGRKLGHVPGRRDPLHFAPPVGHGTSRQRHSLDRRGRDHHNRVVRRERVLRFTQLLNVALRVGRILLREADQREVLLLPEIAVTYVNVV